MRVQRMGYRVVVDQWRKDPNGSSHRRGCDRPATDLHGRADLAYVRRAFVGARLRRIHHHFVQLEKLPAPARTRKLIVVKVHVGS